MGLASGSVYWKHNSLATSPGLSYSKLVFMRSVVRFRLLWVAINRGVVPGAGIDRRSTSRGF